MKLNAINAFVILNKYLKKSSPDKFNHSIRVAKISQSLAKKWGESVADAIIAAMLHDIGKSMSKKEMISFCMKNNIEVYEFEIFDNMAAVHGRVSAFMFEEIFKGNDSRRMQAISHAISAHVAGDENMNLLDKIVFIADNVESKKEGKELLGQIRSGQITEPDECVRRIIQQKRERNEKKGFANNPFLKATLEAIER